MPRRSAGVLLHRTSAGVVEVLLVHPGGPFWEKRDVGAWQLPKGEIEADEDDEAAARREAEEELGVPIDVPLTPLGDVRQAGGKEVAAFAAAMDIDAGAIVSGTAEIEWPRGSGRRIAIPEIDAARWMPLPEAKRMMLPSQLPFLDRLERALDATAKAGEVRAGRAQPCYGPRAGQSGGGDAGRH